MIGGSLSLLNSQDWNKYVTMLERAVPKCPAATSPERIEGVQAEVPLRRGRRPRKEESREDLLRRLVDPTLTLEETARILEVCPTTVRRYTNRGILSHERSAGNQRRFKLSSVLEFHEAQGRGRDDTVPEE